jgi:brefeldin A-inhibited guanine nucleotide-exchange protein
MTFVRLFRTTTPYQLFDESLRVEIDPSSEAMESNAGIKTLGHSEIVVLRSCLEPNGTILPAPLSPSGEQIPKQEGRASLTERRKIFKQIIVKCVLQLLLIETTNDLLRNDEIYNTIPPAQLLRMMSVLDQSYQFARSFNEDKELRTGLWKVGMYTIFLCFV